MDLDSNRKNELRVHIEEIMIPIGQCTGVKPGPVSPEIVSLLEKNNYNQAVVLDSNNVFLGGITRKRLRQLSDAGQPLLDDDPEIKVTKIDFHCPFAELLDLLSANYFAFAFGKYDEDSESVLGLVTISDLNKHYVRTLVYGVLFRLEMLLAQFIKNSVSDHMEWINRMDDNSKKRILDYWELAKKRNVDVGPIVACNLADLFNIIGKDKELLDKLGFSSRNQLGNATSGIPNLRNMIMHPVRPLVTEIDEIITLKETVGNLVNLIGLLEGLREKGAF